MTSELEYIRSFFATKSFGCVVEPQRFDILLIINILQNAKTLLKRVSPIAFCFI